MAEFDVKPGFLQNEVENEKTYSKEINGISEQIDAISNNLSFKISSAAAIKARLNNCHEYTLTESSGMLSMSSGLSLIVDKYLQTENAICQNAEGGEIAVGNVGVLGSRREPGKPSSHSSSSHSNSGGRGTNEENAGGTRSKLAINAEIAMLKGFKFALKNRLGMKMYNPAGDALLSAMDYIFGDYVVAIGVAGSGGAGAGMGAGACGSFQYAFSKDGDIMLLESVGGGVAEGADFSGGIAISIFPKMDGEFDTSKLTGVGTYAGASGTAGVGLGIDGIWTDDGEFIGVTLSISGGGGLEAHGGKSYGWKQDFGNIYDFIDQAIDLLEMEKAALA